MSVNLYKPNDDYPDRAEDDRMLAILAANSPPAHKERHIRFLIADLQFKHPRLARELKRKLWEEDNDDSLPF